MAGLLEDAYNAILSEGSSSPSEWRDSPFRLIHKPIAPRATHAIGKELYRKVTEAQGWKVDDGSDGCHFVVHGSKGPVRIRVQIGCLWKEGLFVFSDVRDEDYDRIALIALEPHRARILVGLKADAFATSEDWIRGVQIKFPPDAIPSWLRVMHDERTT